MEGTKYRMREMRQLVNRYLVTLDNDKGYGYGSGYATSERQDSQVILDKFLRHYESELIESIEKEEKK